MDANPHNDDDHNENFQPSVPEIEDRIGQPSGSSYAPSLSLQLPSAMSSGGYPMNANYYNNDVSNNAWGHQLFMPGTENRTYQPSGLSYTPASSAPYHFANASGRGLLL